MSFCTPRNQPYMKDTLFKKYPRKSEGERERKREEGMGIDGEGWSEGG